MEEEALGDASALMAEVRDDYWFVCWLPRKRLVSSFQIYCTDASTSILFSVASLRLSCLLRLPLLRCVSRRCRWPCTSVYCRARSPSRLTSCLTSIASSLLLTSPMACSCKPIHRYSSAPAHDLMFFCCSLMLLLVHVLFLSFDNSSPLLSPSPPFSTCLHTRQLPRTAVT